MKLKEKLKEWKLFKKLYGESTEILKNRQLRFFSGYLLLGVIPLVLDSNYLWVRYLALGVVIYFILACSYYRKVGVKEKSVIEAKKTYEKERRRHRRAEKFYQEKEKEYQLAEAGLGLKKSQLRSLEEKLLRLYSVRISQEEFQIQEERINQKVTALKQEIVTCESVRDEAQEEVDNWDRDVMEVLISSGTLPENHLDTISKSEEERETEGFEKLKNDIRDEEIEQVTKVYVPLTLSVVFASLYLIFFGTALLDGAIFGDSVKEVANEVTFGFCSLAALILGVIIPLIVYVLKSVERVSKTEQGIKYFLNKPCEEVGRGYWLALKGLVTIVKLPRTIRYYDMNAVKIMLSGPESQGIELDISVPYYYERLWDVVTELGIDRDEIRLILEGPEDKGKKGKVVSGDEDDEVKHGYIGDLVMGGTRSYVARRVKTLDAALEMQDDLGGELSKLVKRRLEFLGIRFEPVVVRLVRPDAEMIKKRDERSRTNVEIQTAEHRAESLIREVEGKAAAKERDGRADADIIEWKGNADAAVVLANLKAKINALNSLPDNEETKKVRSLLTALQFSEKIMPDLAKAFANMNLNVYALPRELNSIVNVITALANRS